MRYRVIALFSAVLSLAAAWCVAAKAEDAKPDIKADADQDDAERERDAPAPQKEALAGHLAEGEHGEIGQKQSAGHAELRP